MSQIRVELKLEDGSFVNGVWRAGQSLREFRAELSRTNPHFRNLEQVGKANVIALRRTDESVKSLGERLRDMSIIAGGATLAFRAITGASNGTVGNIVRVNAEMERLRYQLAGMSGAADPMKEASDRVEELRQLAKETPFALNELSNSFVKLTAAGLNPTMRTMRALTDGLAAFGAGDQQLHRVTIALAQMQGKGVLSMEELRQQLGESMPNAMQLFARSMNVTVGELAKMVSSGMVESRSAIQKFFGEVERTYAGSGKFMMQSFSGLMSRIKTELTTLVTTGEMGAAFQKLKENMSGFAEFLGAKDAADFFDTVGRGLQSLMELMHHLSGAVVNLSDFFQEWGKIILYAIGGAAVIKAVKTFTGGILAMKVNADAVAAAWRNVRITSMAAMASVSASTKTQLAAIGAQAALLSTRRGYNINGNMLMLPRGGAMATGPSSAMQAPGVVTRVAGAASSLGRAGLAMTALFNVGSKFLGLLGPIGIGLAVLGPIAWEIGKGIYSWWKGADKAKEAIDDTIASQEKALRLSRESRRQQLLKMRDRAVAAYDKDAERYNRHNPQLAGAIEVAQKKLDEFDAETNNLVMNLFGANIDQAVREAETRIEQATLGLSRDYSRAQMKLDKEYEEALKTAEERGESVRQVEERYRGIRNQARIEQRQVLLKFYDEEIERLRKLAQAEKIDPGVVNGLVAQRNAMKEEMDGWSAEDFRIQLLTGVEDESKKEDRLRKRLEAITEKSKELQAEVNGASGELSKLIYQINRGDFGNFQNSTEGMAQMRDALVETTIAAESLNEIMKGINETRSKGKRIIENQERELLEIEARLAGVDTTDEADFYLWQLRNGKLAGMGDPEKVIQEAIAKVTNGIDVASVMFGSLGKIARDDAFGEKTVERINAVETAIINAKTASEGLAQGLRGVFMAPNEFRPLPGFSDATRGYSAFGPASSNEYMRYTNQGAVRNKPINRQLADAMSFLKEMGLVMEIYSGGQEPDKGVGGPRHNHGNAADVKFVDKTGRYLDWSDPADQKVFAEIVQRAFKNGVTGFGAGSDYMGTKSMHIGYGPAAIWGAGGTRNTAATWLERAWATVSGQALGPLTSAQTGVKTDAETIEANLEKLRRKRIEDALNTAEKEIQVILNAQSKGSQDGKQGTYERRIRQAIESGEYEGMNEKRIDALLQNAIAADENLRRVAQRQKDIGKLEDANLELEDERREAEQRRLDLLEQAKDPNYRGQSDALRALNKASREQLAIAERLYGLDTPEYNAEKARIEEQRSALMRVESAEAFKELSDAARQSEMDAITDERTARRMAFDERIKELTALRDRAIQDGMLVADANIMFERAVAAERKKLREEDKTPLQAQLDSMSNYAKNINEKTKNWAGELSNAIYDSFSDPDAFKNLGRSIRESIARSLTDAAAAAIMKPFEKMLGGDGTEGSGIGGLIEKGIGKLTGGNFFETISNGIGNMMKSLTGGIGGMLGKGGATKGKAMPVGVKHTGGIVGRSGGWTRSTPVMNFLGAPKYHTGGIVGDRPFRSGLNPSEVPIIAQRGEGIFTPDQMKHLGGSYQNQSISINAPISVNASGGTPEQNADLARQISDQTERAFRGIVQQELVRQMRPGGMLR